MSDKCKYCGEEAAPVHDIGNGVYVGGVHFCRAMTQAGGNEKIANKITGELVSKGGLIDWVRVSVEIEEALNAKDAAHAQEKEGLEKRIAELEKQNDRLSGTFGWSAYDTLKNQRDKAVEAHQKIDAFYAVAVRDLETFRENHKALEQENSELRGELRQAGEALRDIYQDNVHTLDYSGKCVRCGDEETPACIKDYAKNALSFPHLQRILGEKK